MRKERSVVSWGAVGAFFVLLSGIPVVFFSVLDSLPRTVVIAWGLAYMGSMLLAATIAIREIVVNWREWLRDLFGGAFVLAFVLFMAHYGQRIEREGWAAVQPDIVWLGLTFLVPWLLAFSGMIIGLLIVSRWDEERQRGDGALVPMLALIVALPLVWWLFLLPWIRAHLLALP